MPNLDYVRKDYNTGWVYPGSQSPTFAPHNVTAMTSALTYQDPLLNGCSPVTPFELIAEWWQYDASTGIPGHSNPTARVLLTDVVWTIPDLPIGQM